eukprot:gene8282-1553_t
MRLEDDIVALITAAIASVLNPERMKEGIAVGLSNAGASESEIARIQDSILASFASMYGGIAASPIAGADGGKKKRKVNDLSEKRLSPVSYYSMFCALFSKGLNDAYVKHPELKPKTTKGAGNHMLRCSEAWKGLDLEAKKKFEEAHQSLKDVLNAEAKALGRRDFNLVERIADVQLVKETKKWLQRILKRSVAAALAAVQAEAEDAVTAALKDGNDDEVDNAEVEEPQPLQKKAKLSSPVARKQDGKTATPQPKANSSEEEGSPKRKTAVAKSPANVATKSSAAVAKSPANEALKTGAAVAKSPAKVEAEKVRSSEGSSDEEEEEPVKSSKEAAKSSKKATKSPVKAAAEEAGISGSSEGSEESGSSSDESSADEDEEATCPSIRGEQ